MASRPPAIERKCMCGRTNEETEQNLLQHAQTYEHEISAIQPDGKPGSLVRTCAFDRIDMVCVALGYKDFCIYSVLSTVISKGNAVHEKAARACNRIAFQRGVQTRHVKHTRYYGKILFIKPSKKIDLFAKYMTTEKTWTGEVSWAAAGILLGYPKNHVRGLFLMHGKLSQFEEAWTKAVCLCRSLNILL